MKKTNKILEHYKGLILNKNVPSVMAKLIDDYKSIESLAKAFGYNLSKREDKTQFMSDLEETVCTISKDNGNTIKWDV